MVRERQREIFIEIARKIANLNKFKQENLQFGMAISIFVRKRIYIRYLSFALAQRVYVNSMADRRNVKSSSQKLKIY